MNIRYKVPQDVVDKRFNVCKSCDDYSFQFQLCRVCQCSIKTKVRVPFAECPKGKWGKYEALSTN